MSPKTAKKRHIKAEIAIVGAGGAGLTAAIAAAEMGRNVVIIEERKPGGTSALAKGFFAAESSFQKHALIDSPRDLAYKIAMNYSHLKIDPRIIRVFIDKSGDTADWLEKMGVGIELVSPSYINQYPLTWHVLLGGGSHLIKVLKERCLQLGVNVLSHTKGKKILTDKSGEITGLLAEKKGEELIISVKSIVLATGGYGGNKKMLKKYCPIYHEKMKCLGAPNMGDGFAMAVSIGAAMEGLGVLHLAGPHFSEKAAIEIDKEKVLIPLAAIAYEPNIVWINKNGERFIDEAVGGDHFESANAVARQPDMIAYIIIDSAIARNMEIDGLISGQGKYKEAQRRGIPGLAHALMSLTKKGKTLVSDSWDEIAEWIGASPDTLKRTIEDYNVCCDRGYDPIFAKERRYLIPLRNPPYYAMKGEVCFLGTIGGIRINHHMEAVNDRNIPISGLYVAGIDAGGWTSDSYCGKLPGNTLGFALNSGRIAGENAARFCLKCNS